VGQLWLIISGHVMNNRQLEKNCRLIFGKLKNSYILNSEERCGTSIGALAIVLWNSMSNIT